MLVKEALSILKPEANTADALKKAFRAACLKHHPDHGGDEEIMKLVNLAYETLKNASWTPCEARAAARETPLTETLQNLWNRVKVWPGIEGEVIGTWLWVSGETWRYKKHLKDLGFRWSPKKRTWYFHEGDYRKKSRKRFTMDDIREMWGSRDLDTEEAGALA